MRISSLLISDGGERYEVRVERSVARYGMNPSPVQKGAGCVKFRFSESIVPFTLISGGEGVLSLAFVGVDGIRMAGAILMVCGLEVKRQEQRFWALRDIVGLMDGAGMMEMEKGFVGFRTLRRRVGFSLIGVGEENKGVEDLCEACAIREGE